jgi:Na+-transporting NADH:ubiquinone oxidoreductase subunit NqrB
MFKSLKPVPTTATYLLILYMFVLFLNRDLEFVLSEALRALALGMGFIVPHYFLIKVQDEKVRWGNLWITFFILLLLADTHAPMILMFALGLVTFFGKYLLRWRNSPVFNPAVFGLVVLSLADLVTTWWGVSFSPRFTPFGISIAMFLTLPIGLFIIWRYQKIPTLIATVISFILASLLLTGNFPARQLLEGTFAFFLLIMATEPKTTPVVDVQEWIFGFVLGASLVVSFVWKLPLPYLLNLMVLNLIFVAYKYLQVRSNLLKETEQP